MRRGDVVLAVLPGDYGKPRPVLVVQGDVLNEAGHASVMVCPLTGYLSGLRRTRLRVDPAQANGLEKPSEVMVDKVTAVRSDKFRDVIGRLDDDTMRRLDGPLLVALGLAG